MILIYVEYNLYLIIKLKHTKKEFIILVCSYIKYVLNKIC